MMVYINRQLSRIHMVNSSAALIMKPRSSVDRFDMHLFNRRKRRRWEHIRMILDMPRALLTFPIRVRLMAFGQPQPKTTPNVRKAVFYVMASPLGASLYEPVILKAFPTSFTFVALS